MLLKDMLPFASNFWNLVSVLGSDDCWPYKGHINENGYGRFVFRKDGKVKKEYAHRVAWVLTNQSDLDVCALHDCDNPRCCNPAHLFRGDRNDNNQDRIAKGRTKVIAGENHCKAKLTVEQVKEIRYLYETRQATQVELAEKFGMSRRAIRSILNGTNWKGV